MKLLHEFCQLIFGCRHSQKSRVFTIKNRTYQVCFDCGRELDYSWERMRSQPLPAAGRADARWNGAERWNGAGQTEAPAIELPGAPTLILPM